MLDYLRENASGAQKPEDAGLTPLPPGSDYIVPAAQEKTIKQGTIVLAILFVVGLAGLWYMVKKTSPNAAMAEDDTQIASAIARVSQTKTELYKGIDDVVAKFKEFSSVKQVSVNELQKNPFTHSDFVQTNSLQDGSQNRDQIERSGQMLQLLSIMKSPHGNCCMINDKILYKGDTINNWKVDSITDTSVELSSDDMKVVLRMSTEG
jgi:hypothetical protein